MTVNFSGPDGDELEFQLKVIFELEQSNWHDYSTESVWCELISEKTVKLKNPPFLTKGVSYNDILKVKERDYDFYCDRVLEYSGHSTYRIHPRVSIDRQVFIEWWAKLEREGCTYESAQPAINLLAVDVSPNSNIYKVYNILENAEKEDVWGFEEGHCGHALSFKKYLISKWR